jgi:hypothetical protein
MRRTALLLKRDDSVCGVDDGRAGVESIQLLEGSRETERINVDRAKPDQLAETLRARGVTDIIADHYQPRRLSQLRENGFTLWISPPRARRNDAEQAWRDGALSEAMLPGDVQPHSRKAERSFEADFEGRRPSAEEE